MKNNTLESVVPMARSPLENSLYTAVLITPVAFPGPPLVSE